MAAPNNQVQLSEVAETRDADLILRPILENRAPTVSDVLCQIETISAGQSNVVSVTREPAETEISTGSTLTEGDDVLSYTAYDPTEVQITLATYGERFNLSEDSSFHDKFQDLESRVVRKAVADVLDVRDRNALAQIVGGGDSSVGDVSTAFDLDQWESAKFTYAALDPRGMMHGFVGHTSHYKYLEPSVKQSAGASFGNTSAYPGLAQMFGPTSFKGDFEGFLLWQTTNAPANSTGYSGAFMPIGESALIRADAMIGQNGASDVQVKEITGGEFGARRQIALMAFVRTGATVGDSTKLIEAITKA